MKLLHCLLCEGELDIIGEEGYRKIVKCKKCGFNSGETKHKKEPEVVVIRRKPV